jgi:hypothetical protein
MELEAIHQTLQNSTNEYDRSLNSIRQCLIAYEKHCVALITTISEAESVVDVEHEFSQLMDVQEKLSMLVFERGLDVGEQLDVLTREFDRLYDPYIKQYWFKKFKSGEQWPTRAI